MGRIDGAVLRLQKTIPQDPVGNEPAIDPDLEHIKTSVEAIETLLGSSVQRPNRWSDLRRHLAFGQMGDLVDIVKFAWPAVSGGLQKSLYAPDEPIPVGVAFARHLVSHGVMHVALRRIRRPSFVDGEVPREIRPLC